MPVRKADKEDQKRTELPKDDDQTSTRYSPPNKRYPIDSKVDSGSRRVRTIFNEFTEPSSSTSGEHLFGSDSKKLWGSKWKGGWAPIVPNLLANPDADQDIHAAIAWGLRYAQSSQCNFWSNFLLEWQLPKTMDATRGLAFPMYVCMYVCMYTNIYIYIYICML